MNKVVREDGRYAYNAPAAYVPGQMFLRPDGSPAILDGLEAVVSGQLIEPQPLRPTLIMEVDSLSATTFAVGASVYLDVANQVANGTSSGNTLIGVAARAKTSGQLSVLVNCNNVL
jgi:hypothetical protein